MSTDKEQLAQKFNLIATTPAEEILRLESEIKFNEEVIVLKKARIAQLRGEQPLPSCDICGSNENVRHAGPWLMGKDMRVCSICFTVWYDESVTSMEEIRKRSLQVRSQAAKHQGQKSV